MIPLSECGHIFSNNGLNLYYEIHGQGLPLLLLHGFTGSGAALVDKFGHLSKNYQLIIPDLRGHGRSNNPSSQLTLEQMALDLSALLEHLSIQTCSAIGFSAGAIVLLHIAYLRPDFIQSMCLVSATPYFPEQTKTAMIQFGMQEKTHAEWQAMRQIHFHGDEQIQSLWTHVAHLADTEDTCFTADKLKQIKAKTLLVQGDRDPLYPLELTFGMYHQLPNAYLWIVPDAGHVPISDANAPEFLSHIQKLILDHNGNISK